MRPIYMILAGVAAFTLATPASAAWQDRTYSHQLQVQIDAGVMQGTISRRESIGLRQDLSRLVRLERRFSPNGISGPEHGQLLQRSTDLAEEIRVASGGYGHRRSHQSTGPAETSTATGLPMRGLPDCTPVTGSTAMHG